MSRRIRFLAITLAMLMLVWGLAGCGESSTDGDADGDETGTDTGATETTEGSPEEPSGDADVIELDFVSFVDTANEVEFAKFKEGFIDKVNEQANGELVINVRGGPEVVPVTNIGQAIQQGSIDMASIPASFMEDLVPGSNQTSLSEYSSIEERENSIYEYTQEMYRENGFHYLGRPEATEFGYFFLFLKENVASQEDFAGLKLGGSPAFHGFYEEVGASVTNIAMPEYHSAMERGVIDGLVTSIYVGIATGLPEVSEAIITPGIYRSNVVLPVNLDKWNTIPDHLQELLADTMAEFEAEYAVYEAEQRAAALERAEEAGANIIELEPDVAEWLQEASREGAWKTAENRFPGDTIPELRDKITK